MTFIEVQPPYKIVAAGRGGKFNRNKTWTTWTLEPTRQRDPRRGHDGVRARAAHRQVHGGRHPPPRMDEAQAAQGAAAACSRSSRRTTIAGRESRWVGCNLRRRMRRLVLIAAARHRLRRLRHRGHDPRGRDRGHLRRRRQPRLPGPDVALPEPGRRRGPRVPDGPAGRHEPAAAGRRDLVRRVDAGQELLGRDADARRRVHDRGHRGERVPADSAGRHERVRLPADPARPRRRSSRRRTRRPPAGRSRAR